MCDNTKNEINETKEDLNRISETNEIILVKIMSDFTSVLKMLTETMEGQLGLLEKQSNNHVEVTKRQNETMNRQLDIISNQNELLTVIFKSVCGNEGEITKVVKMWKRKAVGQ